MKHKIEISIFVITLFSSLFIWHSIYAQEFSPLGKLAQDYILRLDKDNVPSNVKKQAIVVSSDAIARDAVSESIDTISKTVEDVKIEKEQVITNLKTIVKEDIDNSIIDIKKQIEKPAHELQRSVDIERTELFENITKTIESVSPTRGDIKENENKKITTLQTQVNESLQKMQESLETESGLPVNFENSQRNIRDTLLQFQKKLIEKQEIIESRQGDLTFKDTDLDGVSDYDELHIYKTNPEKARTKGEGKSDGEKIKEGINPLSDTDGPINYSDPREDRESFVSEAYRVEKIQLIKEGEESLIFEGVALPNTYVTLYIYSTPIIVTVKTNEEGQWSYSLEKELENGEHQMYVATVDTSGKIIARSNPILFTKTAEAATIGIIGNLETPVATQNFLKDNFILITLATLIAIVILGMMFVGNHKTISSAVAELKNEVNSK